MEAKGSTCAVVEDSQLHADSVAVRAPDRTSAQLTTGTASHNRVDIQVLCILLLFAFPVIKL